MARRLIVEIVGDASSLQRALGSASASTDSFGAKMTAAGGRITSFGKTMTRDMTLPIVGLGAVAAKTAIDFQASMELIHTQAGVGQKAVDDMSKSVVAMAGSVATGPDELSKGLFHLASQGLRGKQALDALRIAAEGAKVGQANLEDVTNALGAVISGKLVTGAGGFNKAMGMLNATVGAGDMHMQDLADAMGTGLPAKAELAGVSLRDVGAALAVFGDNNIRGAAAGTLLNSTIRLMAGPSHAAAKAMGEIGLSANQLGDDLRSKGIVGAIEDLKSHLAGMSKTEQFGALTHMFGGKQAGGVMLLIDQLGRLQSKVKAVDDGGNKFASDWQAYTKTTAYHLASMGAQMQATGVTVGDVMLPVVAKLADIIGSLASKFEELSPSARKFILIGAGVLAALGPIVSVVGHVTSAIGGLSTAFSFLAANPIVLVVVAVAALAAAIAAAVLWPDKLKSVLEKMGLSAGTAGKIVDGLRDVFAAVKDAGEALVNAVRSHWSTISAVISGAVSTIRTIIDDAVSVITTLWRTFGGTLTSAAETVWTNIKNTIHNALEVIHGVIDVITGLIHGDWSKVWKGIEEIVSGTLGQIWNQLKTAVTLLGDAAHLIGTAIWKGIVEPLAKLAEEAYRWIVKELTTAFHELVGWAKSEAGNIGHAIIDGILGPLGGLGSKVEGVMKGALGWFHHPHLSGPPYDVAREEVGVPLGRGVVDGYLLGISPLTGKISSSIHSALEQAKSTINSYRSQLSSTWSTLVSDANLAFEGIQKAAGTIAGHLLASLTSTHDEEDFKANLAKAQSDLANALGAAGGGAMNPVQLQALADAQTRVQIAQGNLTAAIKKYGTGSTQAATATLALQTAQNNLAKAQPDLSSSVSNAFAKMQAAQESLTEAIQKYGAASKQAVAANKVLQTATANAQIAVAGETAGPQQQNDQAVVDAQKNLNDLLYQQMQGALTKQDALEKTRLAARIAERKKNMDEALQALKVHLEKIHATHQQTQEAIIKLLNSYGVSYAAAGKALGDAFADGLRKSIANAEKAAQELAAAVSQYLPHSPAEKGPLSRPIGWGNYLMTGLSGPAAAAAAALASGLSAPSYGGSAGRRGGVVIESGAVQVNGFVGNETQLAYQIRDMLLKIGRRETSIFGGLG
jgi:TP901 family phage tail tape measure protein